MPLRTTIILSLILVLGSFNSSAQSIEKFKTRLQTPQADTISGRSAVVTIREDSAARAALEQGEKLPKRSRFKGWRVCIYSGNSATARSEAAAASAKFKQHFEQTSVTMKYENPYFRVTVGNCATAEEAAILLERVRSVFPKAYLQQHTIALSELL